MANYARQSDLCLRLFGSSLTGEAFRRYSSLLPNSIPGERSILSEFLHVLARRARR